MTDKNLVMSFLTDGGKKTSIQLNGVRDDLTKEEINKVMDTIIVKKIFSTNSGDLKVKDSAQVVEKNVSVFSVK